jgi:hypothetical protein
MMAKRGLIGLAVALVIAQSCTNDFDKFEVTAGGAATSSGGKIPIAGSSTNIAGSNRAGTTSLGGNAATGGETSVNGGAPSAGAASGGAPVEGGAGAAGMTGAGGAPDVPCGGLCTLDHATAECVADSCAIAECEDAWDDCNVSASDGCEHAVALDTANCGACERACATTNIAAIECTSGACSSSCRPGFANCTQTKTPDDGCETPVTSDAANCGGCDNACPAGFVCSNGQCDCNSRNDCGNGNGVQCVDDLCQCDLAACRPGERCRDAAAGAKACSCNGSTEGCLPSELCCATGGCTDVQSNAANCGACGRACSAGFTCAAGACQCDSVEDCGGELTPVGVGGAGAAGETSVPPANIDCVAGMCVCDGNTCVEGQRCLPNGTCG